LAAAKAGAFHLFQKTGDGTIAIDLNRSRRNRQVLARFWFALCDHKFARFPSKTFSGGLPPAGVGQ
jgi:hypothetical protein